MATLDPDGQLSHWLKVSKELQDAASVMAGDLVTLDIEPVDKEPEPENPFKFATSTGRNSRNTECWGRYNNDCWLGLDTLGYISQTV
jgi:hypothetical protein